MHLPRRTLRSEPPGSSSPEPISPSALPRPGQQQRPAEASGSEPLGRTLTAGAPREPQELNLVHQLRFQDVWHRLTVVGMREAVNQLHALWLVLCIICSSPSPRDIPSRFKRRYQSKNRGAIRSRSSPTLDAKLHSVVVSISLALVQIGRLSSVKPSRHGHLAPE